ncbi:hypothetical protein THAOC_06343, partial [Thalassiosira oceanica]
SRPDPNPTSKHDSTIQIEALLGKRTPEVGLEPTAFCSEDRCSTIEPSGLSLSQIFVTYMKNICMRRAHESQAKSGNQAGQQTSKTGPT